MVNKISYLVFSVLTLFTSATLSCAIVAYLHQTQDVFTHYRLIWAVIIASIGANMSAGQSGVSIVLRILGSFAALIICYIVWYVPVGHVA